MADVRLINAVMSKWHGSKATLHVSRSTQL